MKYIILNNGDAVVFGNGTSHKEVAGNRPVLSAGFCRIETYVNDMGDLRAHVSVWGKSDTLGVASDPSDKQAIEMVFMQS